MIEERIASSNATEFKRMKQAALVIDDKLCSRLRRAREAKKMRAELAKLPYICRAGFMKMKALKE